VNRYYLGLSTSGHDAALALLDETGEVLVAESTERFLQSKRAWGAAPDHPDHLRQILSTHCEDGASFVVATSWMRAKAGAGTQPIDSLLPASEGAWLRNQQERAHEHAGDSLAFFLGLSKPAIRKDFEHHRCHAAFACSASPFDDAVCLVLDGDGDVGAASQYRYGDGLLERQWRSWGPGSLGAFYGWLTGLCGFEWRAGEEWKVMGLAAFGSPRAEMIEPMCSMLTVDNGRLRLVEPEILRAQLERMQVYRRKRDGSIMDAADLAASGQVVYSRFADAVLNTCAATGGERLVLAGGCALNSSYNGTILGRHPFSAVYVPCAPGDDGNAVGAALLAWMDDHPGRPLPKARLGRSGSAFLGSRPDPKKIDRVVRSSGFPRCSDCRGGSANAVAELLARGKIVGVMRGAAEFGPRALGHRSILADPRPADMKDRINRAVKGREPYRPFAPMLPEERTAAWFRNAQPSPYMSFALPWKEDVRGRVPAVVHEDGTGRLQTVAEDDDVWLRDLLAAFERRTDVPIILNTSFNVMGKPIVHSVEDALAVLVTTDLDAVLLEDILIEK